jgi:hypothetical protein
MKPPTILVAALLSVLACPSFASRHEDPAVKTITPQGQALSLRNAVEDRTAPVPGLYQAVTFVHEHQAFQWIGLALAQDSVVFWPAAQHVYLTTPQGTVRDTMLLVAEPPFVMTPQSARGHALDPDRLWRQRYGDQICTIMLAAFPRGSWTRSDVTAIRVGR